MTNNKSLSAIEQLNRDKVLKPLIKRVGVLKQKKGKDVYLSLCRSIVSQQLSIKAADTIWNRYVQLFKDQYPGPQEVIELDIEQMRKAGLSYQKAGYLKNIAVFALKSGFDHQVLKKLGDEELIQHLVTIKGVGKWTAEMVLMFTMGRTDVLPLDDLGIQQGMTRLYGLKGEKQKLKKQMSRVAENWRPYRSLACMYIWRYKDAGY